MEVAGDIVQSMQQAFGLKELESVGNYPAEMNKLKECLQAVDDANNTRTQFNANISENIQNVKAFIVRAEASLMINDM